MRVEKDYRFDTDAGEKALGELFDGRSQLLVYHFMFGPSYQAGCPVNSSMADSVDGLLPYVHARDATVVFVSQAALEKLQAYKRRMGWSFPWVSAARTDFNFDLGFSQTEEQSRQEAASMSGAFPPIVEHNARSMRHRRRRLPDGGPGLQHLRPRRRRRLPGVLDDRRGLEFLMGYYGILDRAPKGRDEGEAWQLWIRRHDEYESEG